MRTPTWSFRQLAGALALVAMVVPRLPGLRPRDLAGGVIPIGPFSGGLFDANTTLMSVLLIVLAGVVTALRPARALELAVIFGLAPTAWMVIMMTLHGPGDIWPIALAFAMGYGTLMAAVGIGAGKLVAWLSGAGRPSRAA